MSTLSPAAVGAAAQHLENVANRTPVLTSRTLDDRSGCRVYLKCENFQRVGAFKFRGAYNALSQLDARARTAGVVTHSSGNHAQAVALAAQLLDVKAVIVMPEDAAAIKRQATADYGAEIILCPAVEREAVASNLVRQHGYTLIHPYDNDAIIAGQGTAAWELLEHVGDLDFLLTPVGGGGLLSGSALAAAALSPSCRVIGVEPTRADDAARSLNDGRIVRLEHVPRTIADGLRTRYVGDRNFAVMQRYVDSILTVTEDQIVEAMRFIWERMKIIIEPSAAVAVAPLLQESFSPEMNARVGIIISGGNVDLASLPFPSESNRQAAPTQSQTLAAGTAEVGQARILSTTTLDAAAQAILETVGQVELRPDLAGDDLQSQITDYHALIVDETPQVSGQTIEYGFRLRVIGSTASHVDNIDVSTARALGIDVHYLPGSRAVAVAEYTLGLLIGLSAESPDEAGEGPGGSLAGKTLGIIGYGSIGRQVARRAMAFDMQVLANQPWLTPELALDDQVEAVDLPDLLRQSDFVSLHVPLRAAASPLIGPEELELLKPTAFLVNTSSTELIDEKALLTALENERLAGVALATYRPESEAELRPTGRLREEPKVTIARHVTEFADDRGEQSATRLARRIVASLQVQRPAETLSLQVLPVEQIVPHEEIDEKRVERLMTRLEADGVLVNPPVVTPWNDLYVILDGATRYTALRRLGFPHVIVQIVQAEREDFHLHTWYHVISSPRPAQLLLTELSGLETVGVEAIATSDMRAALKRPRAICYLVTRDRQAHLFLARPGVELLESTNAVVSTYTDWGQVERTLLTDLDGLLGQHPQMVALAVFPQYAPETVFSTAASGDRMPAGLTRFLVPGRILRLNADLDRLRGPEPLAVKRAWLNDYLEEKLARSRLRYYQEPVILLDE